jgi:hypothetical protein
MVDSEFACRNHKQRQRFIIFFDIKSSVQFEFIPQIQTVGQSYYMEILTLLHEAVLIKRPELWPNDWILHHDKASAHMTLSGKQLQDQKSIISRCATGLRPGPCSVKFVHKRYPPNP